MMYSFKSFEIQASAYGFLTANLIIDIPFVTFRKKIFFLKGQTARSFFALFPH